jgi:hypothetical protein
MAKCEILMVSALILAAAPLSAQQAPLPNAPPTSPPATQKPQIADETPAESDAIKDIADTAKRAAEAEAPEQFPEAPDPVKKTNPMPKKVGPGPITITPARAGSTDSAVYLSSDGSTVQLVGRIESGLAVQLKQQLEKNSGIKTLAITSEGGLLTEGIALAHLVTKYKLNVHVEFFCGSACTFPLLAGKVRSMAPNALIGFHQSSNGLPAFVSPQISKADTAGDLVVRGVYLDAKLDETFIEKALSTPANDMWFPDVEMLKANGVVTQVTQNQIISAPKAKWNSPEEYRKELAKDPIWEAARAAKPQLYKHAIAAGWVHGTKRDGPADDALMAARAALIQRLLSDVSAYPDALIDQFVSTEQKIWEDSKSAINRSCEMSYTFHFPVSQPQTEAQKKMQWDVVRQMLALPSPETKISDAERAKAQAAALRFWGRMIAEQSITSYSVANNFCREPLPYFEELMKMPVAERVELTRSLITLQRGYVR